VLRQSRDNTSIWRADRLAQDWLGRSRIEWQKRGGHRGADRRNGFLQKRFNEGNCLGPLQLRQPGGRDTAHQRDGVLQKGGDRRSRSDFFPVGKDAGRGRSDRRLPVRQGVKERWGAPPVL